MADALNWRNNILQFSNDEQKSCKSNASAATRCHLSSVVFTICVFFCFYVIVYSLLHFGLKQHLEGPTVLWPSIMTNTSTNQTIGDDYGDVRLPNEHNRHTWHYNTLILRAWLGTCLALGLLIGLTLIVLIWTFIWKKYHASFKRYFGMRSRESKRHSDLRQFEMQDFETQAGFLENATH